MIQRFSTFRRGFISTFGFDVVSRGLSALATVAFIRALDLSSFAYVVLFLNIGQFAGSALTGGVRMRYLRTEAERLSRGDEQVTGFALAMGASLVLVLGVAVLAMTGITIADSGGSQESRWLFVALTAVYTAGNASIELAMYHYQAHLKFSRAGLIGVARSVAIMAVAVAAIAGAVEAGAAVAGATAGAVLIVAFIVCAPLVWQTISMPLAAAAGSDFGRESGWLTAYFLASAGFAYADIFIVAAFLNDNAVASYGAALRYISIVLGPLPALIVVMRVRTSQRDVVDSAHLQANILSAWIKRTIVPVGIGIAIAALAAPFLIPLLDGGRYPDSIPVFQLMLLPALVSYTTVPGPNLLMSQKRYRLLAVFYAIALTLQLIAAIGVAQTSGVIAVAAVASVVAALETGGIAFVASRIARKSPSAPEPAT